MAFQSSLLQKSSLSKNVQNKSSSISTFMLNPDTEPIIEIDADKRKISVPDELMNIAVAGDHLSETIYFSIPRYFDGEDLSERDCTIRFINAGNEYGEAEVCDVNVDESTIYFGWCIDNKATRYSGKINFTVQFDTVDNNILYQWQTTPAQLNILAGLNIEKTITDKDDVLFRSLASRIDNLYETVESLQNISNRLAALALQIEINTKDIKYIKENVVYTLYNEGGNNGN